MTKNYYKNADLCILVFDLTAWESLIDKVRYWHWQILENAEESVKIMLVGNKIDLEDLRMVSIKDVEIIKWELKIDFYFETSAKTGEGVTELF